MEQYPLLPEVVDPEENLDSMGRPPQLPNGGRGRPRGARAVKYSLLEKFATDRAPELWQSVYTEAIAGNMIAAKIIFDRIWPRRRSAPIEADLPEINSAADILAAMREVYQRVNTGVIAPDEGEALNGMLKDLLAAHSIESMMPPSGSGASTANDARSLLAQRIARVAEDRRRRIAAADDAESAA